MARKSVKGYAEKNYYDNTKFTGGIVATNDPLNEGSFKHLVNFDIADTGQSLTPRKGFLATTLKYKKDGVDVEVALSDKTIYYFDANIGKWIFIDFNSFTSHLQTDTNNTINETVYNPAMYKVEFDVENKYITNVQPISKLRVYNLSIDPWASKIGRLNNIKDIIVFQQTRLVNSNQAVPAIDEYSTTQYIIKVEHENTNCWFTFTYRENESEYEGIKYPADTLVLSCLNTTDVVDTVDTSKRNLASFESIIPDPMQIVYKDGEEPLGFVQQFPMIYVKQDGKYLINTTQKIDGLEIIPNFYLKEPVNNVYTFEDSSGIQTTIEKYQWAYAYDIVSTSLDTELLAENNIFRSNIFSLEDNSILVGIDPSIADVSSTYKADIDSIFIDLGFTYTEPNEGNINHNITKRWNAHRHKDYVLSLNTYGDSIQSPEYNHSESLLLYVVPRPSSTLETIKLPAEIAPINNTIDTLRTVWYSNIEYGFAYVDNAIEDDEFDMRNIPEITQKFIKDYNISSDILNDYNLNNVEFDKTKILLSAEAAGLYKLMLEKCSIMRNYTSSEYYINSLIENITEYLDTNSYMPVQDLLNILRNIDRSDNIFWYYIKPLSEINKDFYDDVDILNNNLGYDSIVQTAMHSDIISFNKPGMDLAGLKDYLNNNKQFSIIILNPKKYVSKLYIPKIEDGYVIDSTKQNLVDFAKLFPGALSSDNTYYVCRNYGIDKGTFTQIYTEFSEDTRRDDSILKLFSIKLGDWKDVEVEGDPELPPDEVLYNHLYAPNFTFVPNLDYTTLPLISIPLHNINMYSPLFRVSSNRVTASLSDDNNAYVALKDDDYFAQGLSIILYLLLIPSRDYISNALPAFNSYTRDYFVNTTSLVQTRQLSISSINPSTYIEYLTEEPTLIKNAKEYFIFNSTLGDHLVTWSANKIYISKESKQYYFPATGYSFSYPETIVKAIQYKDMILVFTTQNLYAVYFTEYVTTVQNGTDDQGNPKYVQQSTYEFATLPVLYNLMVDERYKDAIQVYNQMILFYSADGQMFLIKPTAAIDSNTRFSIQYFNKSANDILLNYKDYMQERLQHYGRTDMVTDVNIKVSTSINFIKIFYNAPDIMTYILIYDIINNRWYTYDTLLFTNILGLHNIPSGELYTIEDKNKLYFALPYVQPNSIDNNVDIASFNNFYANPIKTEIDTGVINLNNHLKKRFKDLHVIYKNLNASAIEFSLDTFIDDIPITVYLGNTLEVRNVAGSDTIVLVEDNKVINFLEDNSALFNFLDYNSNKVITHRSSIVSKGKAIRTKMYFTSKGRYKIQGYGLIYKEHTV